MSTPSRDQVLRATARRLIELQQQRKREQADGRSNDKGTKEKAS